MNYIYTRIYAISYTIGNVGDHLEVETLRVYLGVKTCEVFICFVAIVRVRAIVLTSLFSLFYVTGECHRMSQPYLFSLRVFRLSHFLE